MSITAYFVSEQKLKDYTPISPNLDSSKLVSAIRLGQDIVAQESLGQSLYEKMQQLITTGDISLSGNTNYKELLDDYIVPCCIWNSYYISLDFGLVEFANAGLVANSTEQGASIDLATFKTIKGGAKTKADFYTEKLNRWLRNQSQLYPEYNDETSGEIIPNPNTGFRPGIVFNQGPICRDEILFYGMPRY